MDIKLTCPKCKLEDIYDNQEESFGCSCGAVFYRTKLTAPSICGKCGEMAIYLDEKTNHICGTRKEILSPKHYEQHKIQVMQFCQENNLGWCTSNVIKYVCRENKKNGLEDLKKARQYLDCLINYKETGIFLTPDKLQENK